MRLDPIEDFSYACVLMLLDEQPAGAGELREWLLRLGLSNDDPELVNRTLQALLRAGLVRSTDGGAAGGRRDMYCLTREGDMRLAHAADELRSTRVMLGRFLARCGERFVGETPVEM